MRPITIDPPFDLLCATGSEEGLEAKNGSLREVVHLANFVVLAASIGIEWLPFTSLHAAATCEGFRSIKTWQTSYYVGVKH